MIIIVIAKVNDISQAPITHLGVRYALQGFVFDFAPVIYLSHMCEHVLGQPEP